MYQGRQLEKVAPLKHVTAHRVWHVPKDHSPHPEVLVPLKAGQPFRIPWQQNKVAGQANQPVFIDVYVPKTAVPGPFATTLSVSQNGKPVTSIQLKLRVARAALPDTFHIAGDMNTYGSPARAMGVRETDPAAFMAMERKYYRLAHQHRMTLNVLPYSQSGRVHWHSAPKLAGRGADMKIVDWKQWDDRYGPLLAGQAFSKATGYVGPGKGKPIRHIYLPFHENWPAKLADHFRPWPPPKDYNAFLKWQADLPPIEKCLSKDYAAAWQTVLKQFQQHLTERKWTQTRYHVYLNNKYYFRRSGGRGISLWLLDEPMHADDFLALAYYGRLTRAAMVRKALRDPNTPIIRVRPGTQVGGGQAIIDYRIDISRPMHQRNWLDGVVDLNVCADQLYPQRRLIAYRKRVLRERYWNYRMPPSFGKTNVPWAVWPVRSFCWGATGTLPWQTIASDGDLYKADATALMYPGRKFGLTGPVPSLRMKAWRDGLQLAELLRMLKEKTGWNDLQLRAFVGQVCGLDGWKDGLDPKSDSEIVTFSGMTANKLVLLQRTTIHLLEK